MKFSRTLLAVPAAAALCLGGVASAHPRLMSSTPTANTTVASPNRLMLKFSEKLIGSMTAADVLMTGMPGGARHQPVKIAGFKPSIAADGKSFVLARPRPLAAGTYRVVWHAVAVDTHRVAGAFAFSVK
jgi:methionine-rich copper-binding protein CopC